MQSPLIVPAELDDASAILELQRQAYQAEALLYNDWSIPPLTQSLAQLMDEFQDSVVLKAVSGTSLLGSVRGRAADGVAHIGRLIVAPAAQRRGIGTALLRGIESAFPHVQRFELFTGSKSEGNIRLYRTHGYAISHERALSPSVTLVYMSKANDGRPDLRRS
ncbi:MAG TPA: GNAT family N-acetyltransferase [Steroidobacteraceae bacterium]|jgi:ribosomal protein S18 acetylase RimI-like enzyme